MISDIYNTNANMCRLCMYRKERNSKIVANQTILTLTDII